jgi:hypothetical protein
MAMADAAAIPDEIVRGVIDPAAYADGRTAHGAFRWLRANNPLGNAELEGVDPFWVVTKHADILEISRQNDLFLSGARSTTFTNRQADARVRQMTGGSPHLVRTLVQMDAPDHPKHRLLTQSWFLPQNIRHLEDRIRQPASTWIAWPSWADEPRMLRLTQELFGASDPELNRSGSAMGDTPDAMAELQAVIADFFMYFKKITDDRKAEPRRDLATVIATGQIDGAPISDFEAMSYYVIVATAGHDTTSSSTAGAIWGLCEAPAEFAKVRADPALIPGLVDESIRWVTPVKHFMRSASGPYDLRGRSIAAGDWFWLAYPSGNRDEEVFEAPDEFRVGRNPNRHSAFGYGAHLCLGQHLAKMEMRILWEELIPRLETLELAGEPKLAVANFVGGPKRLPIRYRIN